jgi:YVTN family beta-propeller protein
MRARQLPSKRFFRALGTLAILVPIVVWGLIDSPTSYSQSQTFKNFESPQVHPLALTPDGTRLLAVNSPNGTLSVFQLVAGFAPRLTAEIPVGLEPVSVAVRNNNEAWVVNWLSDSISIIDLSTGNVTRSIDVGDEPTDIVFAGSAREMAFVCVSGGKSLLTGTPVDQLGRGQIKVFDATNPGAGAQTIEIFGKQPRALARNADGSRVFVSVFESGNQTTVVREQDVTANGGLPPPNPAMLPGLPPAPNTALIVKRIGSQWQDELGRNWNAFLPFTLADVDLAVIDASSASLPSTVAAQVSNIGTHIGNMAFDSAQGRLIVANLEDINQVRFEPNLRGRFQHSRVAVLNNAANGTPALASTSDLNSHVDFGNPAGSDAERALSLALPADIVRKSDGTFYVAATSSGRVGVLSSNGDVTDRIAVGQGPTGLALDESRTRLYVLNRFAQTISVVDTNSKSQVLEIAVGFNPEPSSVTNGRRLLYDASLSAHGTVSCASCHLNGHRDGMAWDLGNPQGTVDIVPLVPFGTAVDHPMKGPMTTQSLRGITANTPLHWRGDRATLTNFNPAFVSLLGSQNQLSAQDMAAFETFVSTLVYPPNPNQGATRQPNEFNIGSSFFIFNKLDGGQPNGISCSTCHTITNFAPGTNNTIIPKEALQEPQPFKVPQLRGLYQKVGIVRTATAPQITGFGLIHDGTFDTLFNFMKAPQFNFAEAGSEATADSWRRDMEQLMLRLDTGTPPAIGLMTTVDATNKSDFAITNRINILMQQSQAGNIDLVVHGIYGGRPRGFLFTGTQFQPDSLSEATVTLQQLLASANTRAELTFVGVPKGEGRMRSIDLNNNGILNDDEPRTSVSITGRVVDANGVGISGVIVTLSGSQGAVATTDAAGTFVFNFVTVDGTHTVTPSKGGLSFTPQNRTFTNPNWNKSATFTTSPTANASDVSAFFVFQHYNDFLNRDPDTAGLNFWIGEIENCSPKPQCIEVKRINVSAAFFLSIEFQETGFLVYRAAQASFGNLPGKPVPITFSNLMTDGQRIGRNVQVGVGNWQAQLETNKVAFFQGWVQRPEFLAVYPNSMSPAQFIDKLNTNTGDALTQPEEDALVAQLSNNNNVAGRALAVRQVAENAEFNRRQVNRAFVLMQYFGYLRRNPDDVGFDGSPDPNFNGFNFWLNKLNEFNGNFVHAEMVKAFILSIEYRQRFGQ